jgi:hypothetical protein
MNRLDGKVALISGAARGLGAETARLMVEAGARVVVGDILEERGWETVRVIGTDASAVFQRLDVTSEEDWNAAIGAATARWGRLDILVNNAGMFLGKGIEEASIDEWHRLDDQGRGHLVHQIGRARVRSQGLPYPRQLDPPGCHSDRYGRTDVRQPQPWQYALNSTPSGFARAAAAGGHVFRSHQLRGDLHQIPDSHPGVRQDGDYIPPAGLGLSIP